MLVNNKSVGYLGNYQVIGSLLTHIASLIPEIPLRKLIKIVYLIDERFVAFRGFPLTWLDYYAWEKGPVAREVYGIKGGNFSEFVGCRRNESNKCIITPKGEECKVVTRFSAVELALIDETIKQYKDTTADELTDITHETDTLWSRLVKEKGIDFSVQKESEEPIELRALAVANGMEEIFDDARWNAELQAALNPNK